MKKIEENYSVVQSNPLVEGQYKLDVIPQKIIRYLVSRIKPDDSTFKDRIYKLSVSDFASITGRGYDGQTIEGIKNAAEKLLKTQITIRREREITRTNWLASYKHHLDEGWFEFSFSIHLERELLQIRNQFTQYHLANISKLKSQYSIRLYELLKQYVAIGYREFMLDELRAKLGIGEDEYNLFGDIKRWVLSSSHKEINDKTDLEYQWKPIKHVRKIIGVEFYDIQQKVQIPTELIVLLPPKHRDNKDILANIRKWLEIKDADYISQKIHYTISRAPEKFGDYLYQALENDYGADYDPVQAALPFENGVAVKIPPIRDGVRIEVDGVEYTIEDGLVRTVRGVIPTGQLREGIQSGQFRVVDQEGGNTVRFDAKTSG